MNMVGLFLEIAEERDYLGLFSFLVLSYLLAPFQAFAAVKGILEKEEGPWFRTPKTGRITDSFVPGRFSRLVKGIFRKPAPAAALTAASPQPAYTRMFSENPYAVAAATNPFRRTSYRYRGKILLIVLLLFSFTVGPLAVAVPLSYAATSITIDTNSSGITTANTTTLSWNHTTNNNSNRLLIVGVTVSTASVQVSSITYNTTSSLTKLGVANFTASGRVEMWYMLSPPAGTNLPITITTNNISAGISAGAVTFDNVAQTSTFGTLVNTTGFSTSSSVTVTTNDTQMVVDTYGNQGTPSFTPTAGSGQTEQWNIGNSCCVENAGSTQPGAASSTTMTWSWTNTNHYGDLAVPINEAAVPENVLFLLPLIFFLPRLVKSFPLLRNNASSVRMRKERQRQKL